MNRQVSHGSAVDYQVDEQAVVTLLSWPQSSRRAGRCRAAQMASIRQMSRQVSRGSAGEYQADEQAGVARLRWRVSGAILIGNLWRVFFQPPCPAVSPSSEDTCVSSIKEIFFYYLFDYFSPSLSLFSFSYSFLHKCQNVGLNSLYPLCCIPEEFHSQLNLSDH